MNPERWFHARSRGELGERYEADWGIRDTQGRQERTEWGKLATYIRLLIFRPDFPPILSPKTQANVGPKDQLIIPFQNAVTITTG
jgi:hypothetical protein